MTDPSGGGVAAAVNAWLATPSQNATYVSGVVGACAGAPFATAAPPNAAAAAVTRVAVMSLTLMVPLLPGSGVTASLRPDEGAGRHLLSQYAVRRILES